MSLYEPWTTTAWRTVLTGVVAAVIGTVLFFVCSISGLIVLENVLESMARSYFPKGPTAFFTYFLLWVYGICLCVPWVIGARLFARHSRWACSVGYAGVWFLFEELHVISDIAHEVPFIRVFLAGAVLMCFIGGDLGDRARRRKELARMREEDEAFARESDVELPATSGSDS